MLLRVKCTSVIMCIRLIFPHRVSSYFKSESKFSAMAKSKKTRPNRSSNLTGDILKELQATIAFACFDSPSLLRRGTSMAEAQIESMMSQIYYGDDSTEAPDPALRLILSVDTACPHENSFSEKRRNKKLPSLAGHAVSATQTFSSVSIRVSTLDTRDFDFDTPKSAFRNLMCRWIDTRRIS